MIFNQCFLQYINIAFNYIEFNYHYQLRTHCIGVAAAKPVSLPVLVAARLAMNLS